MFKILVLKSPQKEAFINHKGWISLWYHCLQKYKHFTQKSIKTIRSSLRSPDRTYLHLIELVLVTKMLFFIQTLKEMSYLVQFICINSLLGLTLEFLILASLWSISQSTSGWRLIWAEVSKFPLPKKLHDSWRLVFGDFYD